jgi:4-hydroxybenzoate polyprenyltransferase
VAAVIAPDLKDPAERQAYQRELRRVGRPLRLTGIAFLLLGLLLGVARLIWWPPMPVAIPLAALVLGAINMLAAIGLKTVYHARRMKGD